VAVAAVAAVAEEEVAPADLVVVHGAQSAVADVLKYLVTLFVTTSASKREKCAHSTDKTRRDTREQISRRRNVVAKSAAGTGRNREQNLRGQDRYISAKKINPGLLYPSNQRPVHWEGSPFVSPLFSNWPRFVCVYVDCCRLCEFL
jgi:hypothetical protein